MNCFWKYQFVFVAAAMAAMVFGGGGVALGDDLLSYSAPSGSITSYGTNAGDALLINGGFTLNTNGYATLQKYGVDQGSFNGVLGYTGGSVTSLGGYQTAPAFGGGNITLTDGKGETLAGTVTFNNIYTIGGGTGSVGSGSSVNAKLNLVENVTWKTLTGGNADPVFNAMLGKGSTFTVTFNNSPSLQGLLSPGSGLAVNTIGGFGGQLSVAHVVPAPSTIVGLLGLAVTGVICTSRRKKK